MQIDVHLLCWLTGSRARSVKARFAMEGTENLLTARAHPCPIQQSADGAVRPYPSAHLRRQAHMAYPMQQPAHRPHDSSARQFVRGAGGHAWKQVALRLFSLAELAGGDPGRRCQCLNDADTIRPPTIRCRGADDGVTTAWGRGDDLNKIFQRQGNPPSV